MTTTKLINRREVAQLLGVNPRTVFKLEQEGMPVAEPGGPGKPTMYAKAAVLAWRKAEQQARTSGPLDPAQERARRDRAQAVLSEQAFKQRARELLPANEVERVWSAHVAAVRTKLLSWPATLADRLHRAATNGVGAVERELEAAVREVLTELSSDNYEPMTAKPKRKSSKRKRTTRRKAPSKRKATKRAGR